MFDTNQPSPSTVTPRRALSRRRLLVGLAGSGALLLLGSPAIYATVQRVVLQERGTEWSKACRGFLVQLRHRLQTVQR